MINVFGYVAHYTPPEAWLPDMETGLSVSLLTVRAHTPLFFVRLQFKNRQGRFRGTASQG